LPRFDWQANLPQEEINQSNDYDYDNNDNSRRPRVAFAEVLPGKAVFVRRGIVLWPSHQRFFLRQVGGSQKGGLQDECLSEGGQATCRSCERCLIQKSPLPKISGVDRSRHNQQHKERGTTIGGTNQLLVVSLSGRAGAFDVGGEIRPSGESAI